MNSLRLAIEPDLIHSYIDAAADAYPDHLAVTFLEQSLSYEELRVSANKLARYLVKLGIKRGDRVGIYMPKSISTPVALYGIMKAGASYVPLDPSAPVERIRSICDDCEIECVISSSAQRRGLIRLSKTTVPVKHVIGVDSAAFAQWNCVPWAEVELEQSDPPALNISTEDLAYIIYTSGSTGVPKGIMHNHRSGLCFSRWAAIEYGFTRADRLSNHAPLHFDLSIMDYFSAAIVGATLVIVPEDYTKLPASYSQLIEDQGITVLYTVPFALTQLLLRGALEQRNLSCLRYAIFGGEPFPTVYLRKMMEALPHVTFDNMYGPAEVNGVSHYTVTKLSDDRESVPIGKIAQHASSLIMDEGGEPVAEGEAGELLVCSPSMMLGYWRRDDLTKSSLYVDKDAGSKVYYRTGDLVERSPDGTMRFVGRKDRQVKIRGYRVELDEIEMAIAALNGVEEGAAYVVDTQPGTREIRAEVTVSSACVDESGLVRSLKTILPWYAIPAQLTVRNGFPRTATGKIDRRTLQMHAQEHINQSITIQGEGG